MRKRRHIIMAVIVMAVMMATLLPAQSAKAQDESGEGLVIGWPGWDDQYGDVLDPTQKPLGGAIGMDAARHFWITLGWNDGNGNITPISHANIDDFYIEWDGEGSPVFTMETGWWEYSERAHRNIFVEANDGLFEVCFYSVGDYTLYYDGPEAEGKSAEVCSVYIYAGFPMAGVYSEPVASEATLLGADDTWYGQAREFYILTSDYGSNDEGWIKHCKGLNCELEGDASVDLIEEDYGYKVVIADYCFDCFSIHAFATYVESHYDEESQTWNDDAPYVEDLFLNFSPQSKYGLVIANSHHEYDEVDEQSYQVADEIRASLDMEAMNGCTVYLGILKGDDSTYSITPDDINFAAYDLEGNPVDFDIKPATIWDEAAEEDVYTAGFFDISFPYAGVFRLVYTDDMGKYESDQYVTDSVWIYVQTPWIGIYTFDKEDGFILQGSDVYYGSNREYYILVNNIANANWFALPEDFECTLLNSGWAELTQIDEVTYKLVISDECTGHLDISAFCNYVYYHYEEEEDEPVRDGDEDFDRELHLIPMEKTGLVADYTHWKDNDEGPEYRPEDLHERLDLDAKNDPSITFGWKDADGNVTRISEEDIGLFKAYDLDGNEVEVTLTPSTHWDDEQDCEVPWGEGTINVRFDHTGFYKLYYDHEYEPVEGTYMTNWVYVYVRMPEVGLYSADDPTEDNLLVPSQLYTQDIREFYVYALERSREYEYKDVPGIIEEDIRFGGPWDDGSDEWMKHLSIESTENGGYKITVLPDVYDGYNICIPYESTNYYWDGEENDWEESDVWYRDFWVDLRYPDTYGLSVYCPEWGGDPWLPWFGDFNWFSIQMNMEGYSNNLIQLAWFDAEGNMTPVPLEDVDDLLLVDENGEVVWGDNIRVGTIWDEEAHETVPLNIDGLFDLTLPGVGKYTIYYMTDDMDYDPAEGTVCHDFVNIFATLPTTGVYTSQEVSEETVVGSDECCYRDGLEEYYIIIRDFANEWDINEYSINDVAIFFDYDTGVEEGFVIEECAQAELIDDHCVKVTFLPESRVTFWVNIDVAETHYWYDGAEEQWSDGNSWNWGKGISFHYDYEGIFKEYRKEKLKEAWDLLLDDDDDDCEFLVYDAVLAIMALEYDYELSMDENKAIVDGMVTDLSAALVQMRKNGWIKENGIWYYYTKGVKSTGWLKVKGTWYYLNADGAMQTGWLKDNNYWYYLADGGAMQTGWLKLGDSWYYLAEGGKMQTGWQKIGGYWYYFADGGKMQTGWQKISGYWYYFADGGKMQTGWQKIGGYWYYFADGGKMQTGWQKIGGYWYYFAEGGKMQTGWLKLSGNWYYFAEGGKMQTGWLKLNDNWYLFKDNGSMAAKEWVNGYWLNADGTWTYAPRAFWRENSKGEWYGDTSGWYAKNETIKIDGKMYTFDARGYKI